MRFPGPGRSRIPNLTLVSSGAELQSSQTLDIQGGNSSLDNNELHRGLVPATGFGGENLSQARDRMIVTRILAVLRGPVAHCLARLATTLGDFERARVDFDSARKIAAAAGVRPHLAWIEYDYARMLVREGKPASRDRIAELAASAATAARGLGMNWLAPRADGIVAAMAD